LEHKTRNPMWKACYIGWPAPIHGEVTCHSELVENSFKSESAILI